MYSISVAQYRPHRPHRLQCGRLQGILAVGTKHCLPTARDHYRPLSNIPPAYRPLGNVAFSGSFFLDLTVAVDAGDTLRAFSGTSMSCRRMEPVAKSFREGEVIMEVLSSRVLVRP